MKFHFNLFFICFLILISSCSNKEYFEIVSVSDNDNNLNSFKETYFLVRFFINPFMGLQSYSSTGTETCSFTVLLGRSNTALCTIYSLVSDKSKALF